MNRRAPAPGEQTYRDRSAVPWRGTGARSGWGTSAVFALIAMMGVVAIGSWWTADAAVDGDPAGTLLRFALTAVAGTYYLLLLRSARRRRV